MAAVQIESGLLATGDVDLLYDSRRNLKLAANLEPDGLLGLLRRIDRSFAAAKGSFRAINDDGFMVDLIRAVPKSPLTEAGKASIGDRDDLQAVEIEGLAWLVNSPKLRVVAIDERGYPVTMSVPDPRSFALHKAWLSARDDREPIKRRRDMAQARLVARLVAERSTLAFEADDLAALPATMRRLAADILPPARDARIGVEPDW